MEGQFGDYRLVRRLGAGGMAEVFLARRPAGPEPKVVCLKRILRHLARDRAVVELFLNEARLAAKLVSPHIARVYEVGQVDGADYIAMEFIAGADLGRLRERSRGAAVRAIGLGGVVRLITDVCSGLHVAHETRDEHGRRLGIVHGDVHPRNVMVTFDGVAKVIDFGVARAASAAADQAPRGTYAYMAPEQLQGGQLDRRSDVFAVGALLWELVTGRSLFRRAANYLTLRAVIEETPPTLYGCVGDTHAALALDRVVRRATAKAADDRYPAVTELASDLTALALDHGWNASAAGLAEPVRGLFARERDAIRKAVSGVGASSVEDWLVAVEPSEDIDWLFSDDVG
jgi:serine/threonine protein kinase